MATYISRKLTMTKKAAAQNKLRSFTALYNKITEEFDSDSTFDSQPGEKLEKIERAVWGKFFEGEFPSAAQCEQPKLPTNRRRRTFGQMGWSKRLPIETRPSNSWAAGGTSTSQTGESAKPTGSEEVKGKSAGQSKDAPEPLLNHRKILQSRTSQCALSSSRALVVPSTGSAEERIRARGDNSSLACLAGGREEIGGWGLGKEGSRPKTWSDCLIVQINSKRWVPNTPLRKVFGTLFSSKLAIPKSENSLPSLQRNSFDTCISVMILQECTFK
ncbi:f9c1ce24-2004-4211-9ff1-9fb1a88ed89c [Sclerotinia trifoliorum]|uniref:F9c1ce24-2004-4211-9ff1-9fb1a88ed89c n=1 Tax=Sclerotinia trifoliorum TaxID=28548 RepID=A0A8H2VP34_9HELO|nr:f9c1ce24-2004-4211-9ff1-9fb1a88ed89c [Sclerotinia trifoliorum]